MGACTIILNIQSIDLFSSVLMKSRLFLLLTIVALFAAPPLYADFAGVTLSAWTDVPPVIDGDMYSFDGEWDNADSMDFQTGLPVNGTIFVMNNMTHLFILVRIDETTSGHSTVLVRFDNDHDRVEWENNDDGIYYGHEPGGGFYDYHYNTTDGKWWHEDASQDGIAAFQTTAEYRYFEFTHPLSSGDPYDFSLTIGDTVSFQLRIQTIVTETWPNSTNDIKIAAMPLPEPIGD